VEVSFPMSVVSSPNDQGFGEPKVNKF